MDSVVITTDEKRLKQREANRRSYYKNLEARREYYRNLLRDRRAKAPDAYNAYQRKKQTEYRRAAGAKPKKPNLSAEQKKQNSADQYARWAKANPHKCAALAAKRRAIKKCATPKWADKRAIEVFYEIAARVSKCTGIDHEVDHYFPLKSEVVCGLHCEANLQVITADANIRKHNKCPSQ